MGPVHEIPALEPTERFPPIGPFDQLRTELADPAGTRSGGARLAALLEAAPDLKRDVVASGVPTGVSTGDLVTFPFPAGFGLWRAARSPAPLLWLTTRVLVVQWDDVGRSGEPRRRTLLWGPTDHERGQHTPALVGLRERTRVPERLLATTHGTVLGHLRALGLDAAEIDYLAFDHLHAQDVRRLVGTTRPAPDLGAPEAPVEPWLPNATLLVHRREWGSLRHLHPLQHPWYQPATYRDLPPARVAVVDRDVQLGPGVALVATPGHTAGTMSLVLNTDRGVWVASANGIAAESWAPHASRIPGVRRSVTDRGQEVVLNASTLESAARQYDSMLVERLVADPTPDAPFPQCFPSSELTAHHLAPGLHPTYEHRQIDHRVVRGGPVVAAAAR